MTTPSNASTWSGTARMGMGWGLFTGRAGENHPHAHHAVQIVLSEKPQRIWTATQGWHSAEGAVIGADKLHRLEESSEPVTLLYLEPDSEEGRRVAGHAPADGVLYAGLISRALEAAQAIQNPISGVVDCLFPSAQPRLQLQGDPLIERLIAALPQSLPDRFGVAAMAAQTGLSPSRVQHRFTAHTGIAVRPYLRWRRLLTAIEGVTRGLPLTQAAMAAGFSDSAHFTRTFRRHFGIAPSVLLRLRQKMPDAG